MDRWGNYKYSAGFYQIQIISFLMIGITSDKKILQGFGSAMRKNTLHNPWDLYSTKIAIEKLDFWGDVLIKPRERNHILCLEWQLLIIEVREDQIGNVNWKLYLYYLWTQQKDYTKFNWINKLNYS